MKLLIVVILLFIFLPWKLFAPVSETPVPSSAPAVQTEANSAETIVVLTPPAPTAPETTVETKPVVGERLPPPKSSTEVQYTESYVEELERAVHDRINVERVRAGLQVLGYDDTLAQVAAAHSTDMAVKNYFAHEDENGCSSSCRVDASGYKWRAVGENLFLLKSTHRYSIEDASAIIVAGWMGSEGHRRNVLEADFTVEGVGVVTYGDSIYVTEVLARPR